MHGSRTIEKESVAARSARQNIFAKQNKILAPSEFKKPSDKDTERITMVKKAYKPATTTRVSSQKAIFMRAGSAAESMANMSAPHEIAEKQPTVNMFRRAATRASNNNEAAAKQINEKRKRPT